MPARTMPDQMTRVMTTVPAPSLRPHRRMGRTARLALLLGTSLFAAATQHARAQTPAHHHHAHAKTQPKAAASPAPEDPPEDAIVAVINGQVLTQRDVDSRGRLFALSTGQDISPELMSRLRPQIVHQLVDERLKVQEILSRHINIPPEQIADAIGNIESRNGMPKNALRDKLAQDGVSLTTLIDQIRVQLGWMQVLREEIGSTGHVTSEQIAQREAALHADEGQPQYLISEIFIPVADPRHPETELKFTQTIIQQLRDGAPFPIVAAEFSQSESALDGGQMGWTQEDALDPQVVSIVRQMPEGAISNPIRVAGGYVIATLAAKRTIGHQIGTMVSLRQAFFPFDAPLNPQAPTDQQKQMLQRATQAASSIHSCDELAALNKQLGEKHQTDPGTVQLERLNPQMRSVLATLAPGQPSRPLVSGEGIAILMICAKQEKNIAQQTPSEIADELVNDRVEQESRQLTRDLQRRAVINMHGAPS
ncbi:peptidyl-prolyl cis-trans isomerase [Tanticharoenia sakaeratensis NBRC 103193]|uniref:Parvulin-like PPIase n=2 Tax=Tanticharoenia TaxID=444052 RepID=A0A0D6MJ48_9PROT|nr:peptidyl-prolyl cis-trans isomerase [Tanticharoenia sakaeratensis NBRC 103193]GBQ17189.1 peptidyl-prolyl cis-trans isomerase [Tanticharoenia sakaeratensis NBRC 103193]